MRPMQSSIFRPCLFALLIVGGTGNAMAQQEQKMLMDDKVPEAVRIKRTGKPVPLPIEPLPFNPLGSTKVPSGMLIDVETANASRLPVSPIQGPRPTEEEPKQK
jgi:hypothetical protein